MAVGDDAAAAGLPLVPSSGEDGRVRWGSREINRTRDFIAQVRALLPNSNSGWRTLAGITSGPFEPTGGLNGDIYIKHGNVDSPSKGVYIKASGIWVKIAD